MTEIRNIKVTVDERNLIINNGADKLPLNPTSQGFSGQSVRKQLSQAVTGARGSVLALMIEKFAIIEDFSNTVLLVEVRLVGDDLTFIYADGREFKFPLDVITNGLEQEIITTNERIDGLLDDMNLAVKIDYDTITRTDNDELQVSNEVINDINSRTKNNDFVAYQQLVQNSLANIYTKPEIDAKLLATYKPKGTITETELLAITPTSENEGFVYNISTEFTTTIDFIEGEGITHRAGENVVIVEISEGVYKFDVLSGFVDLSSYALKTDIKEDVVFQATSLDSLTSEQKSAIVTQIGDVLTSGEIDKEKFKNFILEITLTGNKHYYQCVQYFLINGIATLYFASTQTTGIIKLNVDTLTPANSTLTNYKYYDGIQASASSFSGSTTNYLQSKTNVDEAIKELDAQVKTTNDSIPDISLNDNTSTEGKYISKLEIDSVNLHKINITKADLPTIPTVTNDLTDALKSNYDAAYTHSTQPHAPSSAEANVQSDWNQTINTEDDFIKNKPTIPSKTSDLTNDSGFATETYVNNKVSAVYKPQGSLAFNDLVVGLLVAANSGFVYNITEAFTTNENFVEGAGKSHSAGTNVVIIEHSGNYKFDVLGGTVDLTPYELQSNKVSSWSAMPDNTKYTGEKLVKDSLDSLEQTIQAVSDLSPFHYEGTFIGGDVSQNDFDNLIVGFEDLRDGTKFNETKLQGSYFICSEDSAFYFNTTYHWSAAEGTNKTSAIVYTWVAPFDLDGVSEINMKAGDIISILDFSYDSGTNTISTIIKLEKNLDFIINDFVVKNESITPATKAKITYDAKGLVTAGADLIADDIPQLPQSKITGLVTDLGNKQATLTFDSSPTSGSTNPVTSGGVYTAISAIETTIAGIEDLLEAI